MDVAFHPHQFLLHQREYVGEAERRQRLGFTDVFALVKQKLMRVEGDIHPFMANLLYFKDVLAAPRKEAAR